jgi:hypothetical protein
MNNASASVCHAFLGKLPPEKRSALLKLLPRETEEKLEALPKTWADPTQGLKTLALWLGEIHYSWFAPILRTMPQGEILLFLSSLSDTAILGLKKILLFSATTAPLTPQGKKYLHQLLYKKLTQGEKELLPLECLPESSMNALLEIRVADLNALIDFLGLHDLAVEVRHIIETAKLKKINEALSANEQAYLRILLQSREPVTFARMGITNWQGDAEALKSLIRQRGLNRLAKAVQGQHSSFIWYLTRRLDIDRSLILQKLIAPLENSAATSMLAGQVLELLSYMRQYRE